MFAAVQHAIDLYGYNVAANASENAPGGVAPVAQSPQKAGEKIS